MASSSSLLSAMEGIASRISTDMSERDVETAFLQEGFYSHLGYEGIGKDLRSEWKLPDDRRPDYATLNDNQAVTAVFEFKNPMEDLGDHDKQLFGYTEELKADYGILTNGQEFRLFQRDNGSHTQILTLSFETVTEDVADTLIKLLRKPRWEPTDATVVNDYLVELEQVQLARELGREEFFETFRLEEGSPFANLVTASMDLLKELRDVREEDFVTGAYNYWERTYASEPKEIPESWEGYLDKGKHDLKNFMFCLETAHALLSRLLLAKAVDDNDFFPAHMNRGLGRYFDKLGDFDGRIQPDAYPVAANGLIRDMREDLVESLFEDDIFVWWKDGYKEQIGRGHETPENQFRDVAKGEESGIEDVVGKSVEQLREVRKHFSEAVAEVLFAVLKFDFTAIEGDPLGNLYQRYFDPETRKALGEFYTPQPVIEYIMDGVEYDRGVSNERLIDPSCGSGTFLVEAIERYLEDVERYHDNPDWERYLSELCIRPHIVGLDIHPFAVLMAQIRFTVAILPKYKIAKNKNPDFTIRRLPIFRTDSLQNERESAVPLIDGTDHRQATLEAISETDENIEIPVPLPLEAHDNTENEFHIEEVRLPLYGTVSDATGVSNYGEYFGVLQAVLDIVKAHMNAQMWEYQSGLPTAVGRYVARDLEGIEEFTESYINSILDTVHYLQEEKGDGRLFKIFEDGVLSLVVKNYLKYEYVVGNPPYVRIQNLPEHQKTYFDELYASATGNYDLYCPFYERGLEWLTEGTGRLGYIAPNQFMVTDYGEGIRRVMLNEARIKEVYDFRDSGVFEDATNYPAIVILEDEDDAKARLENQIRCVRVKANVENNSGRELDEAIISAVRDHREDPGYSDEFIDVFDFPQKELDSEEYWGLMPPDELEVFRKLENHSDGRLEEVTDSVFAGTQTSANKVYVVTPVDADRIGPQEGGNTVRVVPSGEEIEYEIETDLLRPWLKGRDIQRWQPDWSGQHVILPYHINHAEDSTLDVDVCSKDYLMNNLPLTWRYFQEHRDELEGREGGRMVGDDEWYAFIYPKSHDRFERPKAIGAHIAENPRFMVDSVGVWYFKTAYGIQLLSEFDDLTDIITAQLNSKALDFYFKHITTVKAGGYYEYRAQYLELLPCITSDGEGEFGTIRSKIQHIIETIETANRTARFPEAYLGDFSGELEYIDYRWKTRRYPVNAGIQALADGGFAVEAGRSDRITDPRMENEVRARYVLTAVDGCNVREDEVTSIPIPRRDEDVKGLLEKVESDKQMTKSVNIKKLEKSIDESVYSLFGLTEDDKTVIGDYLEYF